MAASSGYRLLPHTADAVVEAWGATRAECLRQAVLGLVALFAATDRSAPVSTVPLALPPEEPEDLLVSLLQEVLYLLDADEVVVADARVAETPAGGLSGELLVVPSASVIQHGAVPKAIARSDLELAQRAGRWRCQVTVDV